LPSEVPLPPDFNVTASTGEYPALSLSGTVDKGLTQVLTETEAAIKKSAFTEQRRTGSVEEGRVTLFLADQSQRRVAIALARQGKRHDDTPARRPEGLALNKDSLALAGKRSPQGGKALLGRQKVPTDGR
jgi:hypothetical protein